jgi:signal transduction histidine kinase/CheY-like chemotaxis protein/PAS domain-containing protein
MLVGLPQPPASPASSASSGASFLHRHLAYFLKCLLFGFLLLGSAYVHEGNGMAVNQAILWLPTGVAIAGVWLLGVPACWVVLLATFVQRTLLGYSAGVSVPAALGSTAEAVAGAWILRRLGFRSAIARIQDVLILFAAACTAPLASILFSWMARTYFWSSPLIAFYSGWAGWWRMNALGFLTVFPVTAVLFSDAGEPRTRGGYRLWATAAAAVLGCSALVFVVPPGAGGIVLLNLLLPVSLYSAICFGQRGAALTGSIAAVVVAFASSYGFGPFVALPMDHRHGALQIFELALLAVPLIFGALIAEAEAERARGAETERLRESTQKALPDVTYRIRDDGRCLDLYIPEGQSVVTPARELVAGRELAEFLPPEAVAVLSETLRRVLTDRTPVTVEFPLTVDGRRRIQEARCVAYGAREMLAVVRDITERRLAERTTALGAKVLELIATGRPATEVFSAIVEGMEALDEGALCSIALFEEDGLHLVTAPSLPAGYRDAVQSVDAGIQAGSGDRESAQPGPGQFETVSHRYRETAREHGFASCWGVPISDAEGRVLGAFTVYHREARAPEPWELQLASRAGVLSGIALDRERRIDTLRQTDERLRQSQKMEAVGKLAGGVAHDFNNLLTVILGYTETIREAVPAGSAVRFDAEEVLAAARRAAGLTRQLLAYSRQQVLSPQVLDLRLVVDQLGGMLSRLIGEHIRLLIRHDSDAAWARVDRSQLEQVILNLVVNARDALAAGGEVVVATSKADAGDRLIREHPELEPGPYVAISVHDNGEGMSPEVQRRAFDPFFTTKELGKGTGLGLATVYGIVRQSGGAVWFASEPGAGTTVWIYLPRVQPPPEFQQPIPSVQPEPDWATILVVEDEDVVRNLVCRTLRLQGHKVLTARDGVDALEVAHADGRIDLLITDIVMPRMGGRELAMRLLAERPGLPVLFMSGYTSDAQDSSGLKVRQGEFMQKPFSTTHLIRRVKSLLAPV